MNQSELSHLVDPLREMLYQFDMFLNSFSERNGFRTAGMLQEILPQEVLYSFKVLPATIPGSMHEKSIDELKNFFDFLIVPEKEGEELPEKFFSFPVVSGFGKDAAVILHENLEKLIKITGTGDIRNINIPLLQEAVKKYNTMRSLVRGIGFNRKAKPGLLSNSDLVTIFEAAGFFPPDLTIDYLANILKNLTERESTEVSDRPECLVYAEKIFDGNVLDAIEEEGFTVSEDDSANGRRQFDISLNPESEYIYYEILDSFTYKPLAPGLRKMDERYELLYKLIKSQGIDLVIFLKDQCSNGTADEIDFLRKKLMRSGVDPLVVSTEGVSEKLREYRKYSVTVV